MKHFGNGIDTRAQLMASEKEVWRAITPQWQEFYTELWQSGALSSLCESSLVIDSVPVRDLQGVKGLFFRQKRLPFLVYPFEWSQSMFYDAASKCLDLHEALFRRDLCLLDSHPWNFVFHGGTPLWVDLTSISNYDSVVAQGSLKQFISFFLNPLWLLSNNQTTIARSLLAHAFHDVPNRMCLDILSGSRFETRRWPYRLADKFLVAQEAVYRTMKGVVFERLQFSRLDFGRKEDALRAIAMLRRQLEKTPPARF